jgi:hypothetical protein
MTHRFTDPTPTSRSGRTVAEVFVDDWEIECCGPLPAVGEPTTWRLRFVPAGDPPHELDAERSWLVERRGTWTALADGPVVASWLSSAQPAPEPGRNALRGQLIGSRHGGSGPDAAPEVTGTVLRVRLASCVFRLDGTRTLVPQPGTFRLVDVPRSPRRFAWPDRPIELGVDLAMETGVLLDLAVPDPAGRNMGC